MAATPLHIASSGHFSQMPAHFMKRGHPSDNLVIWVLAGRGFAKAGPQAVGAGGGDLLVFPRGVAHEYGSDPHEPWEIVWAHFAGPAAAGFVTELRRYGGLVVKLGVDPVLRDRFFELVIAHAARTSASQALADCLLWGVLGLIRDRVSRPAAARGSGPRHRPSGLELEVIQGVQRYIQEHLNRSMALGDLARQARTSPRNLTRLCHRLLGASPMQYVIQQRMAKAALLLAETSLPMKQVADAVGCRDPYYFSRLFHRTMHATPTAYRRGISDP